MDKKTGLWYRCREFITEQSAGEWDDKAIADDTDKLFAFAISERQELIQALEFAAGIIGHPDDTGSQLIANTISNAKAAT